MRKPGYIQRRGKTSWRIRYSNADGRQSETIEGTLDDAKRELANRIADISKGIHAGSKPTTVLFGELCKDVVVDYRINGYRSIDDIEARFRLHIEPALGRRKASQITTAQLKHYILLRQGENASTGTINRELEAIRHAFKLSMQGRKLYIMPHVPMLRENNVRQGFFTREEVDRLCSHLRPPLDSFVKFGYLTGWRLEEIRGLKWSNVDFVAGQIRLEPGTTKNGKGRVFPMTEELRRLLEVCALASRSSASAKKLGDSVKVSTVQAFSTQHVFSFNGRPVGQFFRSWRTANHKAGLPCIYGTNGKVIRAVRLFHDLRRSCVKLLLSQGIPEYQVMRMCGWLTRSVLDRYAIFGESDLASARDKMDAANLVAKGKKA